MVIILGASRSSIRLAELIEGFKARKDWNLFLYICPIAYSLIREGGQVAPSQRFQFSCEESWFCDNIILRALAKSGQNWVDISD